MNNIFKREITIHDKDGKRFDLTITNEGSSTGPYFSICSQSGQFNPKSDIQQQLLDIWNTYHLNGMSPGTQKQMDIINSYNNGTLELSDLMKQYIEQYIKWYKLDYYDQCKFILGATNKEGKTQIYSTRLLNNGKEVLSTIFNIMYNEGEISEIECVNAPQYVYDGDKRINKSNKIHSMLFDGDYEYGSGWIYKDFPDNFEEDLFNLIDKLIEEEDEYNERKITIEDIDNEEFLEHANDNCEGEVDKLMAACIHCGVSWSGLENVTCNGDGTYWDVEGWDYYIYTDEEADEAHLEYIKNLVDDIGFEGFRGGNDINVDMDDYGITISKSISISHSERCYSLAGYDGYENEVNVNGTTYYLYRNN